MKYAIFSDIHGNLEALDVVLALCGEENVDHYICLGDVVGYNANPKECLDIVRGLPNLTIVKGNHDEYASNGDNEMEGFNPHAKAAVLWTREQLTPAERAWLVRAPYRTSVPGCNMTLVHATLDSPEQWGYIFDVHHAVDNFSYQFTQLCFCGHSHVPVAFCKKPVVSGGARSVDEIPEWNILLDEEGTPVPEDFSRPEALQVEVLTGYKYLFNVGSIGQPRNRDPRASFAVFDNVERIAENLRMPISYVKMPFPEMMERAVAYIKAARNAAPPVPKELLEAQLSELGMKKSEIKKLKDSVSIGDTT